MASLTEAVMVSTTAVPAQVQPPESKGRVSIPDAFIPKELSPPLSTSLVTATLMYAAA